MGKRSSRAESESGSPGASKEKKTTSPRYRVVTEALRHEVAEGRLPAGVRLPPLHEMAERFNVSTHTIQTALRILERDGCLYRVPAVGAFVSPRGQGSSTVHRQTTIGLMTVDIGGAFEMAIARGVERACRRQGWGLQIFDCHGEVKAEQANLERLNGGATGVNGAIILPSGSNDNVEHLFRLKLAGFPIVLIDRAVAGLKVDLVESDHEKGAYLATEHLIQKGHRRVLLLSEPPALSSVADRVRGYERAIKEHGLQGGADCHVWVDPDRSAVGVREDRRWLAGFETTLQALGKFQMPVGVFALNDYIAWGLVKACRELKLRVPDDVSIVCFDDSDITRAMSPQLTVVAQRAYELGERALEALGRRLNEKDADRPLQHILVDVDLIERESVTTRTDASARDRTSPS